VSVTALWSLYPGANTTTGWHYNKTLAAGERTIAHAGTVWLPSDYFNTDSGSALAYDALAADFPLANTSDGGSAVTAPQFALYLYAADGTVAVSSPGSGSHSMQVNTSGDVTELVATGYSNP
jgi:hypothetical protein